MPDHGRQSSSATAAVVSRSAPSLYLLFGQVGWFACVMSAARGVAWMGAMVALLLIVIHICRAARPLAELKLVAGVALLGGAWESLLVYQGLLAYPTSWHVPNLAPVWIVALWALFAAQVNTTYRWLKTRMPLAILLGAMAGPLSFHAGASLGALRIEHPLYSTIALALGWASLLPMIVVLSMRWDGVAPATRRVP